MKKLILASAVAVLSVSAQAAPTVYGKAFVTLDTNKVEVKDKATGTTVESSRPQLNSPFSRIGFKGSESVTANTDIVYQLEYGVDIDADKGSNFRSRDTYIGLSNKQAGTVVAGRLTAIDGGVDYVTVVDGGVLGGANVLATFDAPRANNAIAYISPNYNGMTFKGMYVLDENNATDSLTRDAFGVSANFEPSNAPYKVGVSYIQAGDQKITRVGGAFDVNQNVSVAALYQNDTIAKGSEKENAIAVSGTFKTATPWTAYGQLDLVDNAGGAKDAEKQRLAVGGKYAFNKSATGHLYGAVSKAETATSETKGLGIGGGLEYRF